ncbi:MAG: cysteine desulfurase [Schleiferiaceae bacterium]|nr:cysteine desulfurase [Schleiferiaceae bacterium]
MIYFDNAATTPLLESVKVAMVEALGTYGNPSSTHQEGRKAKVQIEKVRKLISKELNCLPAEIYFTSGGTEADNWAILGAVRDLGVQRIITSPVEHHAVLHAAEFIGKQYQVKVEQVNLLPNGNIDYQHLETLLKQEVKTLVSLMHGNNEIGNLLDLNRVGMLCRANNALFHSDTVQTIGHYSFDLQQLPIDFLAASAHKFHGPKGVGFMFIRSGIKLQPLLFGGSQERGLRASTENVTQIVGLGKAFQEAYHNLENDAVYVASLKHRMIDGLKTIFPEVVFNGTCETKGLYTVISVGFPPGATTDMLLFSLDLKGICVSGGSACQSGSNKGSHVIQGLLDATDKPSPQVPLRISFSKLNTPGEVDKFLQLLQEVLQ